MSSAKCTLQAEYPLHVAVWNNNISDLEQRLSDPEVNIEQKDPRGRTALMLATALDNLQCVKLLLDNNANADAENDKHWSVTHEAIGCGNPELLKYVVKYRDYQRSQRRRLAIIALFRKLADTPDFYVEMKWKFSSFCPSVRIDMDVLSLDANSVASSSSTEGEEISFRCTLSNSSSAVIQEVNHGKQTVSVESISLEAAANAVPDLDIFHPSTNDIAERLTSPIVSTFIDTDRITFERVKGGIFGWGSEDKTDVISGYECKVFNASNVQLITKMRTDHLTERDKREALAKKTPIEKFLGFLPFGGESKEYAASANAVSSDSTNPHNISEADYFNSNVNLDGRDIGRQSAVRVTMQDFRAKLWLSHDYPISLSEQVTPIIDLMASNNAHFARLNNFIQLQLPSGFPVKIEIPLYHVLSACITFGNLFAQENAVAGVACIHDASSGKAIACAIDDEIFRVPAAYSVIDNTASSGASFGARGDEQDLYLQLAIQESLRDDADAFRTSKALSSARSRDFVDGEDDLALQSAINESLLEYQRTCSLAPNNSSEENCGVDLELVKLSLAEEDEREARLQREEEDNLAKALELSLVEK